MYWSAAWQGFAFPGAAVLTQRKPPQLALQQRSPHVSRISETDLENSVLSMSETLSAKTSASTLSSSSSTSSALRYFQPWQGGTCPGTLRVPFLLPRRVPFIKV